MAIGGRCHCGRVAYEVDLPSLDDVATCHCAECRRSTGGTHVTWATVPLERFRWTSGAPREYLSSPEGRRYFCGDCGAQLALYTLRAPATIDLTVATLEAADRFAPSRHVWVASRLAWDPVTDGLPAEDEETL